MKKTNLMMIFCVVFLIVGLPFSVAQDDILYWDLHTSWQDNQPNYDHWDKVYVDEPLTPWQEAMASLPQDVWRKLKGTPEGIMQMWAYAGYKVFLAPYLENAIPEIRVISETIDRGIVSGIEEQFTPRELPSTIISGLIIGRGMKALGPIKSPATTVGASIKSGLPVRYDPKFAAWQRRSVDLQKSKVLVGPFYVSPRGIAIASKSGAPSAETFVSDPKTIVAVGRIHTTHEPEVLAYIKIKGKNVAQIHHLFQKMPHFKNKIFRKGPGTLSHVDPKGTPKIWIKDIEKLIEDLGRRDPATLSLHKKFPKGYDVDFWEEFPVTGNGRTFKLGIRASHFYEEPPGYWEVGTLLVPKR